MADSLKSATETFTFEEALVKTGKIDSLKDEDIF
jgi:hypothetical protein